MNSPGRGRTPGSCDDLDNYLDKVSEEMVGLLPDVSSK
jgi:hypothetical protein